MSGADLVSGVATFVGRNRAGQVGKLDDVLSGAFLSRVVVNVVSPGVRIVCDVASQIPPSRARYYYVIDASFTAQCWEAAPRKVA